MRGRRLLLCKLSLEPHFAGALRLQIQVLNANKATRSMLPSRLWRAARMTICTRRLAKKHLGRDEEGVGAIAYKARCASRHQARSRTPQSNSRAQSATLCQWTSEKSLRNAAISAS